jgi:ABC-2 type transport system permease protein
MTFCWFRVWIVGELDSSQFRQIVDLLPKDWRKFSTVDFDWLVSYLGRTALCLDEPLLCLLVIGWSVVRGSDVVSGELNRGSMELLLAQPISRRQVYVTHAICTLVGLGLLVALTWLAMSLGIWTTSVTETTYPTIWIPILNSAVPLRFLAPKVETIAMATEVNVLLFLPGIFKLFCVGAFFGGVAAFFSAWDRYRWRTLGIVAGIYFASSGIRMLGLASEKLSWLVYCNIFGFYAPAKSIEAAARDLSSVFAIWQRNLEGTITGTGTLLDCSVMLSLGLLFYVLGMRHFERRDLPAPV